MSFIPVNQGLFKILNRLIPQIQQITCSRFTNFLTVNTSSDNSWSHSGQLLHAEHMMAVGYLQANYKNHIVDRKGIENIQKLINFMSQSGNQEILERIAPDNDKVAEKNRRSFYIFDPTLTLQEIMECQLVQNRAFNKIICFPKANPIQLNAQIQKFCLHVNNWLLKHHVRALGLTDFTIRSLMTQICKKSKNSTLIHEIINNDLSIYKQKSSSQAPGELILFLNIMQQQKAKKGQNFISFKQIAVTLVQDREIITSDRPSNNFRGLEPTTLKFADFNIQKQPKNICKPFNYRKMRWTETNSDNFY